MPEKIRKIYELKADLAENSISGAANVMGIVDRGRDVTFPGFFKKALSGFKANGFVAVGHDWEDLPVAMPVVAKEDGNTLYTEAVFHSTQRAQDARTVCMERMDNGLSVGLSVGFMPDYENGVKWYDNGADLLKDAESMGCDMSLFDVKQIKACKSYLRGMLPNGCSELYEWSIVTVPMNQRSFVTSVKGMSDDESSLPVLASERDLERFLHDVGFSRKQATALCLHGYKGLQRDADTLQRDAVSEAEPDPVTPPEPTTTRDFFSDRLHEMKLWQVQTQLSGGL